MQASRSQTSQTLLRQVFPRLLTPKEALLKMVMLWQPTSQALMLQTATQATAARRKTSNPLLYMQTSPKSMVRNILINFELPTLNNKAAIDSGSSPNFEPCLDLVKFYTTFSKKMFSCALHDYSSVKHLSKCIISFLPVI